MARVMAISNNTSRIVMEVPVGTGLGIAIINDNSDDEMMTPTSSTHQRVRLTDLSTISTVLCGSPSPLGTLLRFSTVGLICQYRIASHRSASQRSIEPISRRRRCHQFVPRAWQQQPDHRLGKTDRHLPTPAERATLHGMSHTSPHTWPSANSLWAL
jgi:hypothetical protein